MEKTPRAPLATPIVAGPLPGTDHAFVASLCLLQPTHQAFWLTLAKTPHAEAELGSRILALLALQQDYPLLHPVLTPTFATGACAFFMPNGLWSDFRGLNYPPEVRGEVERLAAVLREQHPQYVADFRLALEGQRPSTFGPLPPHWGLADPADEYSLVPPPPVMSVDEAALGKWGTPELFAQLIALDYGKERYLEQATDEELLERATEAMINMHDLTGERTIITNVAEKITQSALARLGEAMEEVRLRKGAIPDDWYQEVARRWGGLGAQPDRTRRALKWIQSHTGPVDNAIARYGKLRHLQEALSRGRFRLGPASGYSADPSLNRAQLAQELRFEHRVDVKRTRFELWDETRTKKLADLDGVIRPTVTRRAATDAYVLCLSRRISARLFHDFDADGCLIIHDRFVFMQRLAEATANALPDWEMLAFDVRYIDKYAPEARMASPLYDKPAAYQYQCEQRVLWLPPTRMTDLTPIWVEISSLEDIAEIIRVDAD